MVTKDLLLFADYYQFYLQDERADGELSDAWTDESVKRMLATAPGTVGIGTARNDDVPVEIEVGIAEPPVDEASWDHVTECSIELSSGILVIAGCTESFLEAARLEVDPGIYRVRVHYGSLDSVSADGLDGEDHYRVVLWPGVAIEVRVLKQHTKG